MASIMKQLKEAQMAIRNQATPDPNPHGYNAFSHPYPAKVKEQAVAQAVRENANAYKHQDYLNQVKEYVPTRRENAINYEQAADLHEYMNGDRDMGLDRFRESEEFRNNPVRENLDAELNRIKQKETFGENVKRANKMKKMDIIGGSAAERQNFRDMPTAQEPTMTSKPKSAPYKLGRMMGLKRLSGPIGKLPLVGSLPFPSNIAETVEESGNPSMSWQDKMLNFLSRTAGVDPNVRDDWE